LKKQARQWEVSGYGSAQQNRSHAIIRPRSRTAACSSRKITELCADGGSPADSRFLCRDQQKGESTHRVTLLSQQRTQPGTVHGSGAGPVKPHPVPMQRTMEENHGTRLRASLSGGR
jgi:hypothetical protein